MIYQTSDMIFLEKLRENKRSIETSNKFKDWWHSDHDSFWVISLGILNDCNHAEKF